MSLLEQFSPAWLSRPTSASEAWPNVAAYNYNERTWTGVFCVRPVIHNMWCQLDCWSKEPAFPIPPLTFPLHLGRLERLNARGFTDVIG